MSIEKIINLIAVTEYDYYTCEEDECDILDVEMTDKYSIKYSEMTNHFYNWLIKSADMALKEKFYNCCNYKNMWDKIMTSYKFYVDDRDLVSINFFIDEDMLECYECEHTDGCFSEPSKFEYRDGENIFIVWSKVN